MERPRSLDVAAGLVALQALALATWGIGEIVRAVTGHPNDKGTALLLGVVVLIYSFGVLLAARGLWLMKRWAQTPTYLVSFFAIVLGIGQVHTLPVVMIPLIAIGAATFIAVSWPASRDALGGI